MTGEYFNPVEDIDDIEDIIGIDDVKPKERYTNKPVPVPKAKKNKISNKNISVKSDIQINEVKKVDDLNGNFNDTSHAKVFVKTWGCAHNSSDSEYMAGQLAAQGYSITNNKERAPNGIFWKFIVELFRIKSMDFQ